MTRLLARVVAVLAIGVAIVVIQPFATDGRDPPDAAVRTSPARSGSVPAGDATQASVSSDTSTTEGLWYWPQRRGP